MLWLGVEALRDAPEPVEAAVGGATVAGSVRRGALVNVLNPHPWIFWITVGVPILGDGSDTRRPRSSWSPSTSC